MRERRIELAWMAYPYIDGVFPDGWIWLSDGHYVWLMHSEGEPIKIRADEAWPDAKQPRWWSIANPPPLPPRVSENSLIRG